MSVHIDNKIKETALTLLQDFVSFVSDEYEVKENMESIFSSDKTKECIKSIKSLLEEYFPVEITHGFVEIVDFNNTKELFELEEFEAKMAKISEDIERIQCRKENEVIGGASLSDVDVAVNNQMKIETPDVERCWLNSDTAMKFISMQTKNNQVAWSSFNNNFDIVFSLPMITALLKIELSIDDVAYQNAFFAPFNLDEFIAFYNEQQGYELQVSDEEYELNRVLRFATIKTKSDETIHILACQEYSDDREINRLHYITHSTEKSYEWNEIVRKNFEYFADVKGTTEDPEKVVLVINKYKSFFEMFNYWLLSFETNDDFAPMTKEIKFAINNITQRLNILKKFKANIEDDEPDENGRKKSIEEIEFDSILDGMWGIPYRVKEIVKLHSGFEDGVEYSPEQIAEKLETTENVILDAGYMFICKIQKIFGEDMPTILQKVIYSIKKYQKPIHAVLMSTPLDDLCFSVRTYNCLHRAGIKTLKDITERTEEEMARVRNLGRRSLEEVIFYLECHGLRLKEEKQESVANKNSERMRKAVNITLDVRPPEYSNFTKGGNGFAIYVNINNNTEEPQKLKLEECSVFSNGRQRASEYTYTGYSFDEEYVFPGIVKTLGKIWITESWTTPELAKGDVFTISFKDINNKIYFFKYIFNDIGQWEFNDYYEMS